MEQAALDPPLLSALQGPPPPDVAELHRQVATAQASALSSAEALATAQQQVRHKHTGGSEFGCLGAGVSTRATTDACARVFCIWFATLVVSK